MWQLGDMQWWEFVVRASVVYLVVVVLLRLGGSGRWGRWGWGSSRRCS